MYELRLFGHLCVEGPSGPLGGRIAQPRQLALLALLGSSTRTTGCSRAKLSAFLWPEADEARGRHLLSDTLYVIRSELGDETIIVSGQELFLNMDRVSVDVVAFERAIEADELEEAVAGYGGPFLEGFHVSGMPDFERWVEAERRRHASRYATALERLALRAEETNDTRGAIAWWRRLAAHDPYSSPVALRLMEALMRMGDHAAALEAGRRHELALRDDLDLEPAPEVTALVARLRQPPSESISAGGYDSPIRSVQPVPAGAAVPEMRSSPPSEASRSRRRVARRAIAIGGSLVAALVAVSALLVEEDHRPLEPDRIVVDVFANQTGDPAVDPLGAMAGHWLVQGLQASGLRVVPFDVSLATLGRDAAPSARGPGRLESLARAGGARIVVSGSYYREGDELRLQAEISDAEKGEILLAPSAVRAPLDSPSLAFPPLRDGVRDFLFRYLNPAAVLDTLPGWIQPPDYEAYRRFVVGMDYFAETDWAAASPYFEEAARLDPTYPPFLYMSAIALGNQGRNRDAQAYLAKLHALDDRMTPYDRATVDWLSARRPVERLRAARRMTDVGPSYVGFYLVAVHTLELNRPAEALEILGRPGVGDLLAPSWPLYWTVRIRALHSLERHEEELEAARQGLAQHPGAMGLVGTDLQALAALGRSEQALEESDGLLSLGTAGIQPLINLGDELHAHGEPDAAARVWGRVADLLSAQVEEDGADPAPPPYLALVQVFERLDRTDEARSVLDALATHDSLSYMEHFGILAARLGKPEEASAAQSWLADRQGKLPRQRVLHARARIAAELGDAERALELLHQAVVEGGMYWSLHRDHGLRVLRDHPGFRKLIRPAG